MERMEIEHTDRDKVLKNLMKFNQSILKKKDTLEGVVELSLFGTEDDTLSATSFVAIPKENLYPIFELLLKQGIGLFDKDKSLEFFGLSKDEITKELFFNFMRIVTERVLISLKFQEFEEIEREHPQVRDFVQNHMQALLSYGILGPEDKDLDLED